MLLDFSQRARHAEMTACTWTTWRFFFLLVSFEVAFNAAAPFACGYTAKTNEVQHRLIAACLPL